MGAQWGWTHLKVHSGLHVLHNMALLQTPITKNDTSKRYRNGVSEALWLQQPSSSPLTYNNRFSSISAWLSLSFNTCARRNHKIASGPDIITNSDIWWVVQESALSEKLCAIHAFKNGPQMCSKTICSYCAAHANRVLMHERCAGKNLLSILFRLGAAPNTGGKQISVIFLKTTFYLRTVLNP